MIGLLAYYINNNKWDNSISNKAGNNMINFKDYDRKILYLLKKVLDEKKIKHIKNKFSHVSSFEIKVLYICMKLRFFFFTDGRVVFH